MKEELQQKLYDKYPKLFAQKELPNRLSAMCYGICTNDGWYNILNAMCFTIQQHIDRKQRDNPDYPQTEFTQIKEKFGGLRVYCDHADETTYAVIRMAESMANVTCEDCGKPGKNKSYRSWYITLCEGCGTEYEKKTGKVEDKADEEED